MISYFKIRLYLKRIINNIFSAKKSDIREMICFHDETVYDNVDFIINSSIIIHFEKDGKEYYFRECLEHQRFREHLFSAIDDYCDNITKYKNPQKLRSIIRKDLLEKKNYKKYIRIHQIFDKHLLFILTGEYDNYESVGLPSFPELGEHKEFIRFIQYSCCIIAVYESNRYLKIGNLENSNANKQLATYKLAQLFGLDNIIPNVQLGELFIGGKKRIGTLMDKADGGNVAYIRPEDRPSINKVTFLKDLTNLEFFDAICYQLDHRLDNYNIVCDNNGEAKTVVAFDNDANRTFFPLPSVPKQTYAGASSVLKDGFVNRPYIDGMLAHRIDIITKKEFEKEISPYLTIFQLKALWERIVQLKKAIKKTKNKNSSFVVDSDKWGDIDEFKELDKQYGKTYYYLYRFDTMLIDREIEYNKRKQCI